jgi:hypothetical protein
MKHRYWTVTLLSFTISACQPSDRVADANPPFDAEREIARWVEAWNTLDLSLVDELFLNDTSVTYFSSEKEGLIRGFAAVRSHHAGFGFVPGGQVPTDELWVENVQASIYPASVVAAGIWYFGNRSADQDATQQGPMTIVYVLDSGSYRIAHMHFSEYLQQAEPPVGPEGGGTS